MQENKTMSPEQAISLIDQVLAEVPFKRNMNGTVLVAISIIREIVKKDSPKTEKKQDDSA